MARTYTIHGHIERRDGRQEAFWTKTGLSKSAAQKLAREQRAESGGRARVVPDAAHSTKKTPAQKLRALRDRERGKRLDAALATTHQARQSDPYNTASWDDPRFKRSHATKKTPAQLDREIDAALSKKNPHARVVSSHGLGTADVRTSEGSYWIVTVPTGYRVDYKTWGPSNQVDLGTSSSRSKARAKITAHAKSVGGEIRSRGNTGRSHATTKKAIPGVAKWDKFAGGTGAAEGKYGYTFTVPEGTYHINPQSSRTGRHAGYRLRFDAAAVFGGHWHELGHHRSPAAAATAAAKHHAKTFA